MAALDNAAAMDAPPQHQEDAFAAFRNAKHDPARREVSVGVFVKRRGKLGWGGRSLRGHCFFTLPAGDQGSTYFEKESSQAFFTNMRHPFVVCHGPWTCTVSIS